MAYGVGKAGCDRMAADCSHELKEAGVAMISLWPGPVKTEYITDKMTGDNPMAKIFEKGETIEFAGIVLAHLAAESGETIMARSGRIFNTADVARQYNIKDIDGTIPLDFRQVIISITHHKKRNYHDDIYRQLNTLVAYQGRPGLAKWLPNFMRIPHWVVHWGSYKF